MIKENYMLSDYRKDAEVMVLDTAFDVNLGGDSIQLCSPDDNECFFEKYIGVKRFNPGVLVVEPIDRFNDHQIALRVREFFGRKQA